MHYSFLILLLALLSCFTTSAQSLIPPSPRYTTQRWDASWIAPKETSKQGVYHFRKSFNLAAKPSSFIIHISADNRYRLFVNGKQLNDGPQISDSRHWRFESIDIAELLDIGENTIAVQVWNLGNAAPVYDMGKRIALIVQGDGRLESVVNTDKSWRFIENLSIIPIVFKPGDEAVYHSYYAAGPTDKVSIGMPWGWEKNEYDDSKWYSASELQKGSPFLTADYGDSQWELIPRSIPLMERTYQNFFAVRRTTGNVSMKDSFSPFTIAANQKVSILLDQAQLTTAFPEFIISKGNGSEIKVTYAEVVTNDLKNIGHRDSINGRAIKGVFDLFYPDGGGQRVFTTLSYRAFRYVQLDIVTGDESLTIEKIGSWFTGYPFEKKGSFAASDPALTKVFDVGWHTARLCAYETYMDCPYWERLQYIGDTRIQALVSYYNSGDDRLARNALEQFEWSLQYDGLTYSRYPSSLPQYIPNYSLVWVIMVNDYMMYRNDPEFVKTFLPGMKRVLHHFKKYLAADKMMGLQPYWDFLDHTYNTKKVLEASTSKQLTTNSLFYAYTLDKAAEVFWYFNDKQTAGEYKLLSQQIKESVKKQCWDPASKMYADTPDKKIFSTHSNILAVLCELIPKAEQAAFLKRIIANKDITQTTLYFDFYLARAMNKAGVGDLYFDLLSKWKDYLTLGLTTFPEGVTRSECHAWSASPNFEMLALFGGVEPSSPGFKTVRVRPQLQKLDEVSGTVPHWAGEISFAFKKSGDRLTGQVTLPAGITGIFEWQGKNLVLVSGVNSIK
ncbi:hypothetical protein BH09BAC3_BH09BAC3_24910 [soil metagenome]